MKNVFSLFLRFIKNKKYFYKKFLIILLLKTILMLASFFFTILWGSMMDSIVKKNIIFIFINSLIYLILSMIYSFFDNKRKFESKCFSYEITEEIYNNLDKSIIDSSLINLPCQRITEDLLGLVKKYKNFIISFFGATFDILIYSLLILKKINLLFVFIFICYIFLVNRVIKKISKPLLQMNSELEMEEGLFRKAISKESDKSLNERELPSFSEVKKKALTFFKKERFILMAEDIYLNFNIILPYIAVLPVYISSKMTFGVYSQMVSSIKKILKSNSFFIESREDLLLIESKFNRFKELVDKKFQ